MKFSRNSLFFRIIAIFLVLFFFRSDFFIYAEKGKYDNELELVKSEYISGNYNSIIKKLEKLLNDVGEDNRIVRGKFFLLLGAAYEQTGNSEEAVENYLLGDILLDKPEVDGIDLNSLDVFRSTLYGKVINGKRVFEKISKRKKKKKFPYLALLGVAAIFLTVFLLKQKTDDDHKAGYKSIANEIFDSIEWVEIPAGEFQMGDNHGLGLEDELPVHTVYLDSYKISKYEITYKQFRNYAVGTSTSWYRYDGSGNDHPVVRLRWNDAKFFCEWIAIYTGKDIALPTEAQWEKAARGTKQPVYPWGNTSPSCGITNYNYCNVGTKPVGYYSSDVSVYGVMDMGGNVWEFVNDEYSADYYSISPEKNPIGPLFHNNMVKILRGGSWASDDVRATKRTQVSISSANDKTGFRIVWID